MMVQGGGKLKNKLQGTIYFGQWPVNQRGHISLLKICEELKKWQRKQDEAFQLRQEFMKSMFHCNRTLVN